MSERFAEVLTALADLPDEHIVGSIVGLNADDYALGPLKVKLLRVGVAAGVLDPEDVWAMLDYQRMLRPAGGSA